MKGNDNMENKIVSIFSKRQIHIPQKFVTLLGFDTEAECFARGNEFVIRPAVEAMMADAYEVSKGNGEYATYDDVFSSEDDE